MKSHPAQAEAVGSRRATMASRRRSGAIGSCLYDAWRSAFKNARFLSEVRTFMNNCDRRPRVGNLIGAQAAQ